MNTPVNFKIAKLIKEKGFNNKCQKWYSVKGYHYYQNEFNNIEGGFIPVYECEAPTIAEVVMWLYEKHGIWIHVRQTENMRISKFDFWVKNAYPNQPVSGYNSPTEAYEAAILYTLNNLI